MRTKLVSRLPQLAVIVLTAYVVLYGVDKVGPTIPSTLFGEQSTSTISVRTPSGTLRAIVASTSADRERGLSGRASLPADTGMLFVFPSSGTHGFWMRDMNFPIDMIWLDAERRVVHILGGVSPDSYPQVFMPSVPAMYVLELDSGGSEKWGIATGTQLVF